MMESLHGQSFMIGSCKHPILIFDVKDVAHLLKYSFERAPIVYYYDGVHAEGEDYVFHELSG